MFDFVPYPLKYAKTKIIKMQIRVTWSKIRRKCTKKPVQVLPFFFTCFLFACLLALFPFVGLVRLCFLFLAVISLVSAEVKCWWETAITRTGYTLWNRWVYARRTKVACIIIIEKSLSRRDWFCLERAILFIVKSVSIRTMHDIPLTSFTL